ncbi:hypothetical protein BJ508DRAFT_313789 [Ascobolus immersus RN42]|uniref:Uncharacterized protein n=1 Tax=Ascobolus immersus RN42 TaxID=1160509 RepID=A0A3N4HLT0_ASCIM|nr:hypothetical protein BJ508DRAFT_313789 [Ascobolus immersus RN42]
MNFYCPIDECDYCSSDEAVFRKHTKEAHRWTECTVNTLSDEFSRSGNGSWYIYTPDLGDLIEAVPKLSATSAPQSTTHGLSTPSSSSSETVQSTSTSSTTSRTTSDETTTDGLRASLNSEYRKKIHADMMATLMDPNADFDESIKRREKLKVWFEHGMKMLEDTDCGN